MRTAYSARAALRIGMLFLFLIPAVCRADGNQAFGILVSLDTDSHSIRIRDPRSGVVFSGTITDSTVVADEDEEIELEDLGPGTPVIADYTQSGDIPEVFRITVRKDLE